MAEVGVQRVLAVINQCFVFKIPPQTSSAGYRADAWPKDPMWTGRLTVLSVDDNAVIELKDPTNGTLFASCPITKGGPPAVQKVADSSRYFVLRIVDSKSGRHAFIGIAFENRSDAFDFNVALDDHQKEKQRQEIADSQATSGAMKMRDYSLKEGQKIKINFNPKKKNDTANDTQRDPAMFSSDMQREGEGLRTNPSFVDFSSFDDKGQASSSGGWETFST